jgi:hypothetical protein
MLVYKANGDQTILAHDDKEAINYIYKATHK